MGFRVAMVVILAGAILLGYNFLGRPKQAPLQFAQVKRQDIKATVSSSGKLTGKNSADLRFKASGRLAYINVKAGDKVFAGQVIAGLNTQDLSIALQQAQNILRDKQATVDKVLDDIHLFQYGNGGFDNVGTANETMTQHQQRTTAEVARDNAFDGVKAVNRDFADSVIISPITGLVTQAVEVPDQIVTGADLITQVVDTSAIYFDTEVDEADIASLSPGQKTEVTLDAYPNKIFKGVVDQIQPQTKTTVSGATVVLVRIRFDEAKISFVMGLSGQASIIIAQEQNTLTIPQEALRDDDTVVVQEGNSLKSKKVTPGIKSDTDVEIKQGLKEDENVLLR